MYSHADRHATTPLIVIEVEECGGYSSMYIVAGGVVLCVYTAHVYG